MSERRLRRTTLGQSQRRVGEAQKVKSVVQRCRQVYERKQQGVWESRLGRCCPSRRDGAPQQLEEEEERFGSFNARHNGYKHHESHGYIHYET